LAEQSGAGGGGSGWDRADQDGNDPEPQMDRRTFGDGPLDLRFKPVCGKEKEVYKVMTLAWLCCC
jgi:hypothetical protein